MYLEKLREFQAYLVAKTEVAELKSLNLLGTQFALCEASKYFFYLRYEAGQLYQPSSRDFELALQEVKVAEARRLQAIWLYWEMDDAPDAVESVEDGLDPDHMLQSS